ncbi:hypothetical protein QE152_g4855 [Popillia japonica]|uniref:Remorin n=1 Tax=Popillia japonica TaxID=7064 RepID=A0AAW1MX50_POPJA
MIIVQYEGSKTQGDIDSISPEPYMEEDEHEEDCEPNEVIRLVMVNDDPSTQLNSDENHENYGSIINVNIPSTNQVSENTNWAKYTPKMLKTVKSKALGINNRKNTKIAEHGITSRVSQWADAKSQLEVSKNKFLEKKHELKLQFMREKHEVELELMKKKAAHEMKLMEEESRLPLPHRLGAGLHLTI